MTLLTRITLAFWLFVALFSQVYSQNASITARPQDSYAQAKIWYNDALGLVEKNPSEGLLLVNKAIHKLENYSWGGSPEDILMLKVDLCNLGGILNQKLDNHRGAVGYFRKAVNMSELLQYEKGFFTATEHLAQIRDIREKEREKEDRVSNGIARWGKKMENSINQFFDQKTIEKSVRDLERLAISQMASMEERKKDYEKALAHQHKLLHMAEVEKDSLKIAETRHQIAKLLHQMGDYEKALKFTYLIPEVPDSSTVVIVDGEYLYSKSPPKPNSNVGQGIKISPASPTITASNEAKKSTSVAKAEPPSSPTPPQPQIPASEIPEVRRRYEILKKQINDFKVARNLDSLELAHQLSEQKMQVELLRTEREAQAKDIQQERFRMMAGIGLLASILLFFIGLLIMRNRSHKRLAKAYNDLDSAHRKLKMAQTKLVESEKLASLGQLTAGIAHEINNPVNFISGNIGPLERDLKDIYTLLQAYDQAILQHKLQDKFEDVNELKEDLEINFLREEINSLIAGINEGATRTSQIVKGLRTFARMDEEVKKPFDVHQGIDSTLTLLNHQCKQIDILKDYHKLPTIEAFPGKINQVFMNLLTNAIQAMDGKGTLQIKTELTNSKSNRSDDLPSGIQTLVSPSMDSSGEFVKISVKDSGKGIPEAIKQRIFEPFFTTKDVGEGTGLGLPICKGIIEDHKGTIEIVSQEGYGTEVVIMLPVKHQGKEILSA